MLFYLVYTHLRFSVGNALLRIQSNQVREPGFQENAQSHISTTLMYVYYHHHHHHHVINTHRYLYTHIYIFASICSNGENVLYEYLLCVAWPQNVYKFSGSILVEYMHIHILVRGISIYERYTEVRMHQLKRRQQQQQRQQIHVRKHALDRYILILLLLSL